MIHIGKIWLGGLLVAVGCGAREETRDELVAPNAAQMILSSPAFAASSTIPAQYTCDGDDESPPLSWTEAPASTKSFAVILDDPDAPDPAKPERTFVHWLVYDLPPTVRDLPADAAGSLPSGARHGKNDKGDADYTGPCPPKGRHRYVHKVYALDIELGDLDEPDKAALERAMQGHVLAKGQVIGTYAKRDE